MASINGRNSQRRKSSGTRQRSWYAKDDRRVGWIPPTEVLPYAVDGVILNDDFATDTGLFTGSNPANPVISGGVLTATPTAGFYRKATPTTFNFWGKSAEFYDVANMFDGSVSSAAFWLRVQPSSADGERLQWDTFVSGGVVQLRAARVSAAGSVSALATLTYSATAHRNLRIRHDRSINAFFWEYRASSGSWITAASYSVYGAWGYDFANVSLNIGSGLSSGTASSNPTVDGVYIGPKTVYPYSFVETFDSGSSPFGFDTFNGTAGTCTLDTTNELHGTGCLAVNTTANAGRLRLNAATLPTTGKMYYRLYLKVLSTPSGTSILFKRSAPAGANLMQIGYGTGLGLALRDYAGAFASSHTLTLNTWYRVEALHDMDFNQIQMRVWNSPESVGSPNYDTGLVNSPGTPDLQMIGQDSSINSSHLIDEFAMSSAGWIGPYVSGGAGNPSRRVAGAWQKDQALQRKVAGSFAGFALKRRVAGVWEDV